MVPFTADLFGDVIVTADDLRAWLSAVPKMDPDSPRAAWYVERWNVVEKVKAAKLRGDFEEITAPARVEPSPFWWTRFRWG